MTVKLVLLKNSCKVLHASVRILKVKPHVPVYSFSRAPGRAAFQGFVHPWSKLDNIPRSPKIGFRDQMIIHASKL